MAPSAGIGQHERVDGLIAAGQPEQLGNHCYQSEVNGNNRLVMLDSNSDGEAFYRSQTAANAVAWTPWSALPFDGPVRRLTAEANSDGTVGLSRPDGLQATCVL